MKIKIKIKVLRKNQPTDVKLDEKLGKTKKPSEANQMTKKSSRKRRTQRTNKNERTPRVNAAKLGAHPVNSVNPVAAILSLQFPLKRGFHRNK